MAGKRPAGQHAAAPGRSTPVPDQYDVAVLGSHLAGSLLAAILARNGAAVVLVDTAGDHARPVGETTVPYTAEVFSLLAERFRVPEIATFAHFSELPPEVRRGSGIKKSLGFLYHEAGAAHDPRKYVQFNVPGEHTEWHLYRPQVDEYARQIAAKHGAHTEPSRSILAEVRMGEDGGTLTLADGTRFAARYVVDASGPDSVLLEAVGAREEQGRTPLRSRLLSAYFSGVRRFEDVVPLARYRDATPWSQGSFHHVFDGGWIQIVDFGNHEGSGNALCSVTVSLCPDRFADLSADPQKAFDTLLSRYPSIAAQFSGSAAAGPWVDEPVWQRRPARTSGPRWVAIERSAGRADEVVPGRDDGHGGRARHRGRGTTCPGRPVTRGGSARRDRPVQQSAHRLQRRPAARPAHGEQALPAVQRLPAGLAAVADPGGPVAQAGPAGLRRAARRVLGGGRGVRIRVLVPHAAGLDRALSALFAELAGYVPGTPPRRWPRATCSGCCDASAACRRCTASARPRRRGSTSSPVGAGS